MPKSDIVPPLDSDPAYAALIAKKAELTAKLQENRREHRELSQQLREAPQPAFRPGVAELLGEAAGTAPNLRPRLAELAREEGDITTALSVVGDRLREARGQASVAICEAMRPEYGRRVAAVVAALQEVQAKRAELETLIDQLECEDIAWTRLTPFRFNFLGDARNGHVAQSIKEAREAGYVE